MIIGKDKVATFHYTLKDVDGEILQSSEGHDPMPYLHGSNNIIPGLERELEGKTIGDELDVLIQPEDAYGELDPNKIQVVPRKEFGDNEIEVGMRFQADSGHGPVIVTISAIEGDEVTVNGNHELAGQTLNFVVKITDVREATQEEIDHGHVHGPGGHQH